MILRKATIEDIDAALAICADARAFQRSQGYVQWADGYPSREVIHGDITAGKGYMIEDGDSICGYCVVDMAGDAEYDRHPEIWAYSDPYVAVHRLALCEKARGKGLARQVFEEIERMISGLGFSIMKVDTGTHNVPMHRLMASAGFTCRGVHTFAWGERLAYEKAF